MNIEALMKAVKEQASGTVKTMYNQNEILNSYTGDLKRHEQKKLATFVWIIPFQLQFPFNPIDPKDINFNSKKMFIVPEAATQFVKSIKAIMRDNEELHKFYAGLAGMKADEYDISSDEITEQDFRVFNQYKIVIQPSDDTMNFNMKDCGKFGMERLTVLQKNSEGEIINTDTVQAQLLELERLVRKEKYAEFFLKNDKSKLNSDQEGQLKAIKESAQVGYPHKSGVLIFLEFACDSKEETLKPITSKDDITEYYRYVNCGTKLLKKLMKRHGKKKDKNLDYWVMQVTYGDGKGEQTEELELAGSREYEFVDLTDETLNPTLAFEDFDEKFLAEINEGLAGKYEKMVKKSVWKFKNIGDAELLGYYHTRAVEIKPYVTKEIYDKFLPVIEAANLEVAAELRELEKTNKLPKSFVGVINASVTMIEAQESLEELDKLDDEQEYNEDIVEVAGSTIESLVEVE